MSSDSPARPRGRSGTEAAIVGAAQRILMRADWSAINVQSLAAEAGVDRKLIYRYFGNADGVVARLAQALDVWLAQTLDAAPPSTADSYRDFARETLKTYLAALRANPLILKLMARELAQDTPALRAMETRRAEVLQAWIRARRPRLRTPPGGDPAALMAVLMAAVQSLALSAAARGQAGAFPLDAAGWARIETAIDQLTAAWPD